MAQINLEGEVIREFSYTRTIVLRILAEHPKSRDYEDEKFREFVFVYCRYWDLELPASSETIRRVRQKIQNTEGLFPPSEEVKMRKLARAEAIKRNIKYI
jgi:hypothetical protein